ncbi:MAG: response regulator transcription factor [Oceanospirillaceae bacterium]|nr:response regulator transcription factor [Oceanospirillaceae bacterium]MCP5334085.1 response regulator transcription factor [Oceanospirillaceae bacterium]MCP5351279.1 response regulator transcription factor [Oceanospirillaceae bacterium]
MRVLVVEDDKSHALFLRDGLVQSGHNVDHAANGVDGLFMATEEQYDVLIVDRMLPKLDGLALVQALRAAGHTTPVLFLSSLSRVDERIRGLRAGGDDYLTKPFEFGEVLARIEALARRSRPEQNEQTQLCVGDLVMNLLTRDVQRAGQSIDLQNKEFRLLEFLMRRADQVVTRTMLLEGVWDFHFAPGSNLIDSQMSKLRLKVDRAFDYPLIKTIKGAGYKITAQD